MFLLFLMMLSDLYSDRIPNGMIPLGIAAGLFCSFRQHGLWGVLYALLSMTAAFLLTYFLFKLGALGAGDVKVFLVVGSFVPIRECLVIVAVSFGIGAIVSIGRLITERNAAERMRYFASYMTDVVRSGRWKLYGEDLRGDRQRYRSNKIHFTVPILLGAVLRIGGWI